MDKESVRYFMKHMSQEEFDEKRGDVILLRHEFNLIRRKKDEQPPEARDCKDGIKGNT